MGFNTLVYQLQNPVLRLLRILAPSLLSMDIKNTQQALASPVILGQPCAFKLLKHPLKSWTQNCGNSSLPTNCTKKDF